MTMVDPYEDLILPDPDDHAGADDAAVADDLIIEPIAVVLERVRNLPPRRYLLRRIWAEGGYGVNSAEDKAGKTWAAADLAVSVTSGTAWMDTWPVDAPGPVVMFVGEGGERKTVRRLEAVCRAKGLRLDDLPLYVCHRAPNLRSGHHLLRIGQYVEQVKPVLVIVDPLYLAAGGADGKDLYAMGAMLARVQALCEPKGIALYLSHHWNKGGVGAGHHRSSGVGPGAWGRTNIAMSVEAEEVEPVTRKTTVTLTLTFQGDEVAEPDMSIRRIVWADDPDDLNSNLNYAIERITAGDVEADRREVILKIVREQPGINTTALRNAAGGKTKDTAALIAAMVSKGDLRTETGEKNAVLHYLRNPAAVPFPADPAPSVLLPFPQSGTTRNEDPAS